MTQDDDDRLPMEDLGFRCPQCGYNLTGARNWRCPECGRRFTLNDLVPPGESIHPLWVDQRPVLLSPDVADLLRTYRIPFELLTPVAEKLWGGQSFNNGIAVPLDYYIEAANLIALHRRGAPLPAPPAPTGPLAEWKCTRCGEENPGTFEVCWNCKREAPAQ